MGVGSEKQNFGHAALLLWRSRLEDSRVRWLLFSSRALL